MSDNEPTFGRTAELENAGWTPIKIEGEKAGGDEISVAEGAEELKRRIKQEAPPLETKFNDPDAEKPVAFERPEDAAKVLQNSRARYAEENLAPEQAERDQELRDRIDRANGKATDGELKAWQENLVAEHQREQEQAQQRMQEQARQREQAAAQQRTAQLRTAEIDAQARGVAVIQSLDAEFPEIRGLQPAQIQTAVAAIHQRNPARAQALVQRLRGIDAAVGHLNQIRAAKAQHDAGQHANYIRHEAEAFDRAIANDPPERRQAIMSGVVELLKSSGIDPAAYHHAARGGGELGKVLASNAVQVLLYRASAALLDAKSKPTLSDLQSKRANPLPPVLRPGTTAPTGRPTIHGAALASQLNAKLKGGGDAALRAAARVLSEKRKAGR